MPIARDKGVHVAAESTVALCFLCNEANHSVHLASTLASIHSMALIVSLLAR